MRNLSLIINHSTWQYVCELFGPRCFDALLAIYPSHRIHIQEKFLQSFPYFSGDLSEGARAVTSYLQSGDVVLAKSYNETYALHRALQSETAYKYHSEDIWTLALAIMHREDDEPAMEYLTLDGIYGLDEDIPQIIFDRSWKNVRALRHAA